jgi:hypothetical protein
MRHKSPANPRLAHTDRATRSPKPEFSQINELTNLTFLFSGGGDGLRLHVEWDAEPDALKPALREPSRPLGVHPPVAVGKTPEHTGAPLLYSHPQPEPPSVARRAAKWPPWSAV